MYPGTKITPGKLKFAQYNTQYGIWGKNNSEWIMTLEGVCIENYTVTILHLSVHKSFRGKGLGKACVNSFISLLKNEFGITKVIFYERLGAEHYYQNFFNCTLGAIPVQGQTYVWELSV